MEIEMGAEGEVISKEQSRKSVIENWLFFKYIFFKYLDFNRIKLFLNNIF